MVPPEYKVFYFFTLPGNGIVDILYSKNSLPEVNPIYENKNSSLKYRDKFIFDLKFPKSFYVIKKPHSETINE